MRNIRYRRRDSNDFVDNSNVGIESCRLKEFSVILSIHRGKAEYLRVTGGSLFSFAGGVGGHIEWAHHSYWMSLTKYTEYIATSRGRNGVTFNEVRTPLRADCNAARSSKRARFLSKQYLSRPEATKLFIHVRYASWLCQEEWAVRLRSSCKIGRDTLSFLNNDWAVVLERVYSTFEEWEKKREKKKEGKIIIQISFSRTLQNTSFNQRGVGIFNKNLIGRYLVFQLNFFQLNVLIIKLRDLRCY